MSTAENTPGVWRHPEPDPLPTPARGAARQRVRLTGAADLITTVPYLIGHTGLADDLVIVAQSGSRVVLTVRVDLAALTAGALWTSALAALTQAGARTVHLIAYPAGPVTDATLRGLHPVLAAACAARAPGLDVERVLTVSGDRWWAHDPTSGDAPQGPGTLVPDNPGLTLQLALGYGVPAASRGHAIAVLDPHPDPVRARVGHLLRHLPPATREQRSAVVDAAHAARTDRPTGWRLEEAAAVPAALRPPGTCRSGRHPAGHRRPPARRRCPGRRRRRQGPGSRPRLQPGRAVPADPSRRDHPHRGQGPDHRRGRGTDRPRALNRRKVLVPGPRRWSWHQGGPAPRRFTGPPPGHPTVRKTRPAPPPPPRGVRCRRAALLARCPRPCTTITGAQDLPRPLRCPGPRFAAPSPAARR
jgi:hypothetical protein